MSPRRILLQPPVASEDDLDQALHLVDRALSGTGPVLAPVPHGPAESAVLTMLRPDEPLEPEPEDDPVALVVATSGSTGAVKGVRLPASAVRHAAAATMDRLGGPGQWLLTLPTATIAGMAVLARSVVAGTRPERLVADDGFSPAAMISATERLSASRRYTALVPTQLWRMAAGPQEGLAALATYDAVIVGGAPLDEGLAAAVRAAGVKIVQTYGMTETCGGCVYEGRPLDGMDVRAPADAPVELGGPMVFAGYRLRPDLTAAGLRAADGQRWHITNDTGKIGADGRLRIGGRLDDVMITGGVNVPAWVVARAVGSHPDVAAVEVLGVPDDEWGQRVVAFVVPVDPERPPTLAAIRSYGRSSLPAAALPRQVVTLGVIPRLPSGKPDRNAMRLAAQRATGRRTAPTPTRRRGSAAPPRPERGLPTAR